jgi:hypothetical protein
MYTEDTTHSPVPQSARAFTLCQEESDPTIREIEGSVYVVIYPQYAVGT